MYVASKYPAQNNGAFDAWMVEFDGALQEGDCKMVTKYRVT